VIIISSAPHCGIHSFSRRSDKEGKATYSVNVRCLEGVDLDAIEVTRFDGRSRCVAGQ
jgi:hypothetical protein